MKNAIYMLKGGDGVYVQDLLNSFILTSKSGMVVVIDGGHRSHTPHFLEKLKEITGCETPHIDAWILTHPHEDHIDLFCEIMENHERAVTVDKIYYHMIGKKDGIDKTEGAKGWNTYDRFFSLLPKFQEKTVCPKLGDTFSVGEMQFEVLHVSGEELIVYDWNNNSLSFKLTFAGKTAIFPGDCGVEAGRLLVKRWGEKLRADICQMSHHGQCGCDRSFYEAVAPKICLWNTPDWLWNNDLGKGYNTHWFKTIEVRNWMDEIGATAHYVIKDGDQCLTL